MDITQLRQQRPDLAELDDDQVVDVIHQAYYSDLPRAEVASGLGVTPKPAPVPARTGGSIAKDIGASLMQGAVGVPQAIVGAADLVSGGRVGKAIEDTGIDLKGAADYWGNQLSPAQKQANEQVQQAEGLWDTFKAAVTNPSVPLLSVVQSAPSMALGGVVSRGMMGVAGGVMGPVMAGAAGEGIVQAGQAAEEARAGSEDKLLSAKGAGAALASGVADTAIARFSGGLAKKLGIADVETMMAGAARDPKLAKGVVRSTLEGMFTEGILEELPQSVQEQVWGNYAAGKPLDEGVNQAAVLGTLSGGVMGGGANIIDHLRQPKATVDDVLAAGTVDDAIVAAQNALKTPLMLPAPVVSVTEGGTAVTPEQRAQLIQDAINARMARGGVREVPEAGDVTDVTAKPEAAQEPVAAPVAQPVGPGSFPDPFTSDPEASIERTHRDAEREAQSLREFPASTLPKKQPTEPALPHLDEVIAPGDILQKNGALWPEKGARLKAKGIGGTVVAVRGGFLVRPAVKETAPNIEQAAPATPLVNAAEPQPKATDAQVTANTADAAPPSPAPVPAPAPDRASVPVQPDRSGEDVGSGANQQRDSALSPAADTNPETYKGHKLYVPSMGTGFMVRDLKGKKNFGDFVSGPFVSREQARAAVDARAITPPTNVQNPAPLPAAAPQASPVEAPEAARVDAPRAPSAPADARAGGVEAAGVEALRRQLVEVEQKMVAAAPAKLTKGGGDIEAIAKAPTVPKALKEQRKAIKEQFRALRDGRETITPSEDERFGQNDAGELLYRRKDGSFYRMHNGKPDFGGDLSPVAKDDVTNKAETISGFSGDAADKKPKGKIESKAKREAREAEEARARYFTPGNVVRGYGGFDEVLEYRPGTVGPNAAESTPWSVKVHEVKEVDGKWVRVGKAQDTRQHSTQPEPREMKNGPRARLNALPGEQVPYTAPRADGQPFPDAPARGGAPVEAATHKDPGQPAEAATAPVIAESLKTAAAREDRTPAQMKADLLGMIDAAIEKAPAPREDVGTTEAKKSNGKLQFSGVIGEGEDRIIVAVRQGNDDNWHVADSGLNNLEQARHPIEIFKAAGASAARAHVEAMMPRLERKGGKLELAPPDMVTFDVPGDGKFKVLNTADRLAEFRRKVETSPGFSSKGSPKPEQARVNTTGQFIGSKFGVEKGSGPAREAVTNMVEEGDYQAALDYANVKQISLDALKLSKDDRTKLDAFLKDNPQPTSEQEEAAPEGAVQAGTKQENDGTVPMFARAAGFDQAVDAAIKDAMDGKKPGHGYIEVGTPSPELLAAGIPDRPLRTSAAILAKAHFDHGVTKSALKELPELLDSPFLVFDSDTVPGSFIVVTNKVIGGRPLVVAIKPDEARGDAFSFVPSLYPKDRLQAIQKWIDAGLLKYRDQKQSPEWFGSFRAPIARGNRPTKGSQEGSVAQGGKARNLDSDGPDLKRGPISRPTQTAAAVRESLSEALSRLKLPHAIHQSTQDAAAAIGMEIPSDAKGFHWRGKIYLIADNLADTLEAQTTFWHEVNHAGLNEAYGTGSQKYEQALRQIAARNKNVRQAAIKWMERHGKEDHDWRVANGMPKDAALVRTKLQAIDEALAELSGKKGEQISGIAKLIAAAQEFMRAIGLNDLANWLENRADSEALSMILTARKSVMVEAKGKNGGDMVPAFLRVFHGSPHEFDAFSTEKMGTGEGAQAYGYGLYFAGKKEVAEWYRDKLSDEHRGDTATWQFKGARTTLNDFILKAPERHQELSKKEAENAAFLASEFVIGNRSTTKEMLEETALGKAISRDMADLKRATGKLYEVEIPEEGSYLLWDKPLSEQPEAVKKALREFIESEELTKYRLALRGITPNEKTITGEDFYRFLAEDMLKGGQQAASKEMHSLGISGIKYLDGVSRNRPLKDIKREFLKELPQDADFDEVIDLIGSGTFSPANEAILKALKADDWLGFDYPSQAISAALSENLSNYDASPALAQAVADAQQDATFNYVLFSDDAAQIVASFSRDQRTVQVDGKRYPAENANGQPVHPTFEGQKRFWKWFGDSAVVNANGAPLVVYHGTKSDFDAFDPAKAGANTGHPTAQLGTFFTADPEVASMFNEQIDETQWPVKLGSATGANTMPVYLSIKNPYVMDMAAFRRFDTWPFGPDFELEQPEAAAKQRGYMAANRAKLEAAGYDGVRIVGDAKLADSLGSSEWRADTWIAFSPNQIKSATGNTGAFNPESDNISFARAAAPEYLKAAREAVADSITAPGTMSWWDKTIGTPYHLAQRSRPFKAVFDRAQDFLGDVSAFATEAADKAPRILPKLESWKDIAKTALTAADTKAVSRPVFEGTLSWTRGEDGKPVQVDDLARDADMLSAAAKAQRLLRSGKISENVLKMWQGLPVEQYELAIGSRYASQMLKAGIVWTDAELKSMFGLDKDQIALYREFRAATDESIKRLAVTDMLRYAGKDADFIRDEVLNAGTVEEAATLLRDQLLEVANNFPERAEGLTKTANSMIDKADRASQLMDEGYAPLMRFGQYTVDVLDVTGERVYFGLFESKGEAARMAKKMQEIYHQSTVTRGTVSQEEYKLFAGVSPETLELFGEMLGLESTGDAAKDKAFQEYIKLAKSNRSSMRRLIHRKGTAGFSEDVGRVLAGFVYSNARQSAANLHMGEITDAVNDIPKGEGQLKDQAVKLADYVKNPQEEAQAVRGLLFAQYLGGSLASAMVNMTQPIQVTMPYLSQFGGIAQSAKQMKNAVADVWKKSTGEADLDAALKHAVEQGIVAPQEVHQLMAQASGRGSLKAGDGTTVGNVAAMGNNAAARLALAWGKFFSSAELFNRRVTFIAAYRIAKAQGIANPSAFAEKAITESQFIYNKGNRPNWARGAIGSTLFTFKTYSISYIELMHRMYTQGGPEGRKAALFGLAMLMLMGGAGGLPFMEDVSDVIDGIGQRMGYNFSLKRARQQLLQDVLGKQLGEFMDKGISGLPGAPLDVSGRLGMGNLIPGTGLFTKKADHSRDVLELVGPAGDFAKRIATGADLLTQGKPVKAALEASPTAARNLAKSWEMATTGQYKDAAGRKVLDVDAVDAALKAVGFQPNDVARVQEASRDAQSLVNVARMRETEIVGDWAQAIVDGDREGQQDARDAIRNWNAANPDTPIRVKLQQVLKKVQNMRMSKADRIERSAPKEVRAAARRELEQAN